MRGRPKHRRSGIDKVRGFILRPWPDVSEMWRQRSGERITGSRCQQIAAGAIVKMREQLREGVMR